MSKFTVQQLMTRKVIVANPSHTFSQVVELFTEFPIRHIPVVDEANKLIGIVSTTDIIKMFAKEKYKDLKIDAAALNQQVPITELMTKEPVTVNEDMDIFDVAELLRRRQFQAVPVVDAQGELVGIVSIKDVLDYFVEKAEGILD